MNKKEVEHVDQERKAPATIHRIPSEY